MKKLVLAFLLLSTPVFADDAPKPDAPKAPPVCTWPKEGLTLTLPVAQVQVIMQWMSGQDYSHNGWASISSVVTPQLNELSAKYCK